MNLLIDKFEVNDGVVRLAVAGEVDLATCDQLRAALEDALTDPRTAELIVDLDWVSFLDSQGIHALIRGHELAAERGIAYFVTNARRPVHRVLDITGVLPILTRSD
jgi:anti-sigma B factor antagonist